MTGVHRFRSLMQDLDFNFASLFRTGPGTLGRMPIAAVFLLAVLFCPSPSQSYTLPDTGQSQCYDDYGKVISCPQPGQRFYGQDAQYRGAQPAYRDNGNGTVSDLNTGLMWQQGDSQNDNKAYVWQAAVDYCSALNLAGYGDWRLPSVGELTSLTYIGRVNPAINTDYFPDCRSGNYWSSSTYAYSPNYAWYVNFTSGYVGWDYKTASSLLVRCVRGGP